MRMIGKGTGGCPPKSGEGLVSKESPGRGEEPRAQHGTRARGAIKKVGRKSPAVVPQPAVGVNIGQPDNLVADHGKARVVIEVENRLKQTIRGVCPGSASESGQEIRILSACLNRRPEAHPLLVCRARCPGRNSGT